jgi:hypothetical protein
VTVVLGHDLLPLFDLSELYSILQPPNHFKLALFSINIFVSRHGFSGFHEISCESAHSEMHIRAFCDTYINILLHLIQSSLMIVVEQYNYEG